MKDETISTVKHNSIKRTFVAYKRPQGKWNMPTEYIQHIKGSKCFIKKIFCLEGKIKKQKRKHLGWHQTDASKKNTIPVRSRVHSLPTPVKLELYKSITVELFNTGVNTDVGIPGRICKKM